MDGHNEDAMRRACFPAHQVTAYASGSQPSKKDQALRHLKYLADLGREQELQPAMSKSTLLDLRIGLQKPPDRP